VQRTRNLSEPTSRLCVGRGGVGGIGGRGCEWAGWVVVVEV
jgi:hypothetical protein